MIGRTYLERGRPVTVRVRWGSRSRGETHGGPRNVLIEREDGTRVVRPFRGLRRPTTTIAHGEEARWLETGGSSSAGGPPDRALVAARP